MINRIRFYSVIRSPHSYASPHSYLLTLTHRVLPSDPGKSSVTLTTGQFTLVLTGQYKTSTSQIFSLSSQFSSYIFLEFSRKDNRYCSYHKDLNFSVSSSLQLRVFKNFFLFVIKISHPSKFPKVRLLEVPILKK